MVQDGIQKTCEVALGLLADRDFSKWQGLPPDCSLEELTVQFPLLNEGVGRGYLGQEVKRASYKMVVHEGYEEPLRVWLVENKVIMLDVKYPKLVEDLSILLKQLGEPKAKLDFFWDVLQLKEGEWVYPARGITLFINPANQILLRLAVFASTTLSNYRDHLRLDTRTTD